MSDASWKSRWWSSVAQAVDKTIFFSFGRSGYWIRRPTFNPDDLDHNMQGKVCLVSGGNSGIGLAIAQGLAERGGEVWILCRHREKGLEAVDRLREKTKNHHIQLALVDVSDLESVQRFCDGFAPRKIDVLVHNAGAMYSKKETTPQGLEKTFATSVAGPFSLTMGLLERLQRSSDARVIFISSGGMYTQKLDLERLFGRDKHYSDLVAYSQGKRAQVILTEMLAKKLKGTSLSIHAMHPGWVDTPGVRSAMPKFYWTLKLMLRSPEQGADTALWLAVFPEVKKHSGQFWFDRIARPTHFVNSTKESQEDRKRLWQQCQELAMGRLSQTGLIS